MERVAGIDDFEVAEGPPGQPWRAGQRRASRCGRRCTHISSHRKAETKTERNRKIHKNCGRFCCDFLRLGPVHTPYPPRGGGAVVVGDSLLTAARAGLAAVLAVALD
jgi:hypothetical protein